MVGLWLLMTVILANLYMSTLTSYLTTVKLNPIPNSLKELVYNHEHWDECLITMQKGHALLQTFYVSIIFIMLILKILVYLLVRIFERIPPIRRTRHWVNGSFSTLNFRRTCMQILLRILWSITAHI